jgi:hypothetical protein
VSLSHLEFYPFSSRTSANLDYLARKLNPDCLRREDPPLILDEAMQKTRPERQPVSAWNRGLCGGLFARRRAGRWEADYSLSCPARPQENDLCQVIVHATEFLEFCARRREQRSDSAPPKFPKGPGVRIQREGGYIITWSRAVVVLSSLAAEDRRGLVILVRSISQILLPESTQIQPSKSLSCGGWPLVRYRSSSLSVPVCQNGDQGTRPMIALLLHATRDWHTGVRSADQSFVGLAPSSSGAFEWERV